MRKLIYIVKIIAILLIISFMVLPGINLLWVSDDIDLQIQRDIESYNYTKGIVVDAKLIENEKIGVNYDKSSHKLVYRYLISHNQQIDTLIETHRVYTYDLKHIIEHKLDDSIGFYKTDKEGLPNLTVSDFKLRNTHKDFRFTRWFSISLIVVGMVLVFFISRQILKILKR